MRIELLRARSNPREELLEKMPTEKMQQNLTLDITCYNICQNANETLKGFSM